MTKEIELTQGQVAIVDYDDFEWLNQWKWCAHKGGNSFYAIRSIRIANGTRMIMMHRVVLGLDFGDEKRCDHINGDGLDNRRENLRIATHAENRRNSKKQKDNTSGYMGVHWEKIRQKWTARIMLDGERIQLGLFDDPIEAAKAYDQAALEYHGEFASLNFPLEDKND